MQGNIFERAFLNRQLQQNKQKKQLTLRQPYSF